MHSCIRAFIHAFMHSFLHSLLHSFILLAHSLVIFKSTYKSAKGKLMENSHKLGAALKIRICTVFYYNSFTDSVISSFIHKTWNKRFCFFFFCSECQQRIPRPRYQPDTAPAPSSTPPRHGRAHAHDTAPFHAPHPASPSASFTTTPTAATPSDTPPDTPRPRPGHAHGPDHAPGHTPEHAPITSTATLPAPRPGTLPATLLALGRPRPPAATPRLAIFYCQKPEGKYC